MLILFDKIDVRENRFMIINQKEKIRTNISIFILANQNELIILKDYILLEKKRKNTTFYLIN
jgi:hypothetical protein